MTDPDRARRSKIEWTDSTWNPVRGCSCVSPGCENCYARLMAARFSGDGQPFHGFAEMTASGPRWTGRVELIPEKLDEPLRWRSRRRRCPSCYGASSSPDCRCGGSGVVGDRPLRVFVNSMSDLFHESLPFEDIAQVYGVMAATLATKSRGHTFQILTKRPQRRIEFQAWREAHRENADDLSFYAALACEWPGVWPLPNVWEGVSCEDQPRADERVPLLLQTPAAVRFVSLEPLLGPITLPPEFIGGYPESDEWASRGPHHPRIDWVIVGGESGPGARPCDVAWIRSIVRQCREASVPCFVKQLGAKPFSDPHPDEEWLTGWPDHVWETTPDPTERIRLKHSKGGDPSEWPEDLQVREFPKEEPWTK